MLSSHTVGFQWPDNSNLANLTPGLCRSKLVLALRLIRSYFSDRTQRVQIDGIMSDFASLLCGAQFWDQ